ncbi:uncharacterized protein SPAPADRAFT_142233 [Spathaspora passalidarum NRRL Y-27907]|uniref:Uncharacterized protein n=1 Tax=Spathaspora passalidarum (strain NRRL Y-27907 / 11-Y1) TaxID=619300 RepID=G3ASM8_SPAPN|nr:uncharacterized protein SPAPADRAFT_142233 [Spathaspora passalidarum NRRL Y-27907]EGW30714.1 hypothetical protein SPAPADRAFT_142233 [Spathaspora passalidarum NRRL Y-27907]
MEPIVENFLQELQEEEPKDESKKDKFKSFIFKCLETMAITISSVGVLALAGFCYHKFYDIHVLSKINTAFEAGDPASQLKMHRSDHKDSTYWVERSQQKLLDDIISGNVIGRYFLIIGEKGTGKTSLILESMKKIDGYNVAMFDAHSDPEIFRIRLGKAINFTFNEDYIGSLFSIKGQRDTTALLDIERAFNKLEQLASARVKKVGKPLIMIINNAHLIKENEEGIKLIELLQQKAEALSGSGLVTMIFNSDDYWVYENLKQLGTRLELINVRDLDRKETVSALKFIRQRYFPEQIPEDVCNTVYDLIGGRPQHINHVARNKDIIQACHEIIDREKTWFLNKCGLLGNDMDDDVMESGKFSSSAMLLMKELVEMDKKQPKSVDHHLPELPLWRCRQIMTRNDYIQHYDNLNIFTIDSHSRVRADSMPMMRAFHEIASQPNFDELLQDTIDRVADIESLERTREIVLKDLSLGGNYEVKKDKDKYAMKLNKSRKQIDVHGDWTEYNNDMNEDDDEDLFLEGISRKEARRLWKQRMEKFKETE